jgi:mutator protein MutT
MRQPSLEAHDLNRLYPKQPIVGVGAVVIRDGKILLEKRRNDPGKGKWSIPGGVVELGENVNETVVREVKEETGLVVEKPEPIDVVDNVSLDKDGRIKYHFVIIDFLVKLKGGTPKAASDAEEVRWVALDEVEEYDLTIAFREFLTRNKEKLQNLSGI